MDVHDFFRILRRSWGIIVAVLAIFLIAGSAYTLTRTPEYTASTQAYVSISAGSTATDLSQGSDYVQQAVKTYAGVATSSYVLESVIKDLKLTETTSELAQQVTAEAPVDTSLLEITATDSSPQRAADIANSVTNYLARAVRQLTPETGTSTSSNVLLTRIDAAYAPAEPSSPNLPIDLGVAALLGLLIGIGAAVLRDRLDTRVRDVADVRAAIDAPVLGELLYDSGSQTQPLLTTGGDDSRRAEAFRTLRTNLQFLQYDGRSRSLVVTSSVAREGKSVAIANLSIVMAEAGSNVVVVDADLRRPQLANYFGLEGGIGLTDVLIGTSTIERALQRWGTLGPAVLPAGRIPPNPSELLQSEAMRALIVALEERFDLVLIDAPPIVPVSDAAILSRLTNGAVVVAAAGIAKRADLRQAGANLRRVNGRVLGTVLTMTRARRSPVYGYESLNRATALDPIGSPEARTKESNDDLVSQQGRSR